MVQTLSKFQASELLPFAVVEPVKLACVFNWSCVRPMLIRLSVPVMLTKPPSGIFQKLFVTVPGTSLPTNEPTVSAFPFTTPAA